MTIHRCRRAGAGAAALAIAAACSLIVVNPARGQSPEAACTQSADSVGQYDVLEIAVALPAVYDNPFDPAQIDLTGVFATPSGRTLQVPGFWYQGYERSRAEGGAEELRSAGPPGFRVRFAWGETGRYRYEIVAQDAQGRRRVGSGEFEVTPSARKGYVRRSARAPLYFEFDSGEPYFAIGENMCWPGAGGTYDYDLWMPKLAANGGNYIRLWLVNEWNKLGLENRAAAGPGNGLGRYCQEASWRVDYILAQADRLGIKAMICIDSFNSLADSGYAMWQQSPYNVANGGPCQRPADFFTNDDAKRLFKQRLRYLVARWGASTAVLSWEFWNEVDLTDGYDSEAVAKWHREMADYLRSIDPWKHLITTSYGGTEGDPAVDGLPELDYVQSHNYGSRDVADIISRVSRAKAEAYGRPHYFGEFGTDWEGRNNGSDREGIHLHNGLWSAMLSQCAGTAMLWWWDNYVEPFDLYRQFAPVAAFAADVDWPRDNYQPADSKVRLAREDAPRLCAPVVVEPQREEWQDGSPLNRPHTFRVGNDGSVADQGWLSRILHGRVNHPAWHNPATFSVDYPQAGRFEVTVGGVSGYGGAALSISLDGRPALTVDFADTAPDDTETMHQYDRVYGIEVPAGSHEIVVEDTGNDWFVLDSVRLTSYLTTPNLRVLALSNGRRGLVWVQNKEHTWALHRDGVSPTPVPACWVDLSGFDPGVYEVERWDTSTGRPADVTRVEATGGVLSIETPEGLTTDTAYKIRRAR